MQIYARVAELGSFTLAAQSLGQPRATVSSAVQQLESWLGVQLLQRTTRKVQITPDGQAFYERSRDLLADLDELQSLFQHTPAAVQGRLRVDMPVGIATRMVLPRLPEFTAAHPQLKIELSSTDRRVDLVRDGFDCVIRVGQLGDLSYIARPLGYMRQINCASPAYLAAHGTPMQLADLAQHQLIHYQPNLGDKALGWEYDDEQSLQIVQMGGVLTVNHTDAYEAACVAGLGLIQVPELGVRHLLASGQLCEVLPQYRAPSLPVSLLYTQRRHLSKRVQVFMHWIGEISRQYLANTSPV